ncbi:3-oxoacyl-[acyl-carrier protein] reductase [Litoreibacter meonggei]|uniref:3-oxoacyl-[acyl-carrier protein] reductase n=1 Tax=Litoreibacter meonggei TaxID=1049199 RepID=A0A497WP95_9RHOB|nr:SDR family oxidoreductase [Litoreibacter meonggei]RLJ51769.1 3-oxoacyl-[acyl-carrier protein] reductase [Litoreibacter meonggei]
MRLEGKTAIVTGGASGFGEGIARKFIAEGANVMIADLNMADDLVAELGKSARAVKANVAQDSSVQAMVQATLDAFGRIDILINNAGTTHLPTPMEDVSEDDFDKVFAVNCKSVYLTAKHIVPLLKKQGSGAILNVASTAGVSPRPRLNWYNASKGWMNTATKAMAVELAPEGIRVNAINPVAGETPLLKSFMGEDTPEIRAKFLSTIPLGRFSTPEDMANAACFLCSEEASMITGVCMEVDGGRCI